MYARLAIAAFCALTSPFLGCGEARYPVAGRVSLRGQPASYVFVAFYKDSGAPVDATMTDAHGDFILNPGLIENSYRVAVFDTGSIGNPETNASQGDASLTVGNQDVPDRYKSPFTSDLHAEIGSDAENRLAFALDD